MMNATPPVYHGYIVIPETCIDGWCLGAMSEFEVSEGIDAGDAFVVAPDGGRADLVWEVGTEPLVQILPPDEQRWGVYAVAFPHVIHDAAELAAAFRAILPQLQAAHAQVQASRNHRSRR